MGNVGGNAAPTPPDSRITPASGACRQLKHADSHSSTRLPRWRKAIFAVAVLVVLLGGPELLIRLAVAVNLVSEPAVKSLREAWESNGGRDDDQQR